MVLSRVEEIRHLQAPGAVIYSAVAAAIGTLRVPKHAGANEAAFAIQKHCGDHGEAEADIRQRVAPRRSAPASVIRSLRSPTPATR